MFIIIIAIFDYVLNCHQLGSVCVRSDPKSRWKWGHCGLDVGVKNNKRLFTGVLFHGLRTDITLDLAAPVELAVAALLHHNLLRVVATAAAQDRTTIQTSRILAANAPMGSCRGDREGEDES